VCDTFSVVIEHLEWFSRDERVVKEDAREDDMGKRDETKTRDIVEPVAKEESLAEKIQHGASEIAENVAHVTHEVADKVVHGAESLVKRASDSARSAADIDGDGKVDAKDVKAAMDVNRDGKVDAKDAGDTAGKCTSKCVVQ